MAGGEVLTSSFGVPLTGLALEVGVANYLLNYSESWGRHFHDQNRRGHWQIVHAALFDACPEGIEFGEVHRVLFTNYRMDVRTAEQRVQETIGAGLIATDCADNLHSHSLIRPTERLGALFQAQASEALDGFYAFARRLDPKLQGLGEPEYDHETARALYDCHRTCDAIWEKAMRGHMRIGGLSPARQTEALRNLVSYAFWHIAIAGWMHQHSRQGTPQTGPLLLDQLHVDLYERLNNPAPTTTAQHVKDLITWKIFERAKGPRNRTAIAVPEPAFAAIAGAMAETGRHLAFAASALLKPRVATTSIGSFRASELRA